MRNFYICAIGIFMDVLVAAVYFCKVLKNCLFKHFNDVTIAIKHMRRLEFQITVISHIFTHL